MSGTAGSSFLWALQPHQQLETLETVLFLKNSASGLHAYSARLNEACMMAHRKALKGQSCAGNHLQVRACCTVWPWDV